MANPFDGLDPDSVLRQLQQQAEDLETKAAQLRTELSNASATATSPDGAVTVTLAPTGALQNITFAAQAAKVTPDKLGPLVMRTVQAAQREVSNRVTASLSQQFGDPETMDFVNRFMPQPEATPTRREPAPDEDGGSVLRKRRGGGPQQTGPDDGGSLLR
ncbi:YbaB/EbfC family nucleoid-associated protein [Actinophytocola glycyrrhizae]|uniref:YbaB/EbfC family nucleoid-associated protein n=1 Tax=Actinophytocola glycyrrhizae TaxID=2044873 RepID=A0ABV9SAB1_9PSEU